MKGVEVKNKLRKAGFSIKAVADLMGETPQNLSSLLTVQDIKTGVLERIAKAMNKPLSFFYAEKIDLMSEAEIIEQDKEVAEGKCSVYTGMDFKTSIPFIPIDTIISLTLEEIQNHDGARFVIPVLNDADFVTNVRGLSMAPKCNNGDFVACKLILGKPVVFQWNKIYLINTTQGALVKRVRRGRNDDVVLIVSDNAEYEPFELNRTDIKDAAIVLAVLHME